MKNATLRTLIINGIIYFALGLGCLVGATHIVNLIWREILLICGGVFMGVLASLLALIEMRLKSETPEKSENQKNVKTR